MSATRPHTPIRIYTHSLTERQSANVNQPYGSYKYDSAKNYLPGGIFHFVRDADAYVPTLHGLTADYITQLKEVAVCTSSSPISNRPFLTSPHLYEVELINTGHESMRQGDRFTVQLPNQQDVAALQEAHDGLNQDTMVNNGIWGGILATRKVNCEFGGDPVEEVIQAIRNDSNFDIFQLISPYTPQSILSMMLLVANGADYHNVSDVLRKSAALAVNSDFNADTISVIVEDETVKDFLKTVVGHALNIVESVQGFAAGQVVRACQGYNVSEINTGDRFKAQVNMNRWLS